MQRRILGLTLALSLALGLPGVPAVAAPAQPLSLTASVRILQAYGIVDKLPETELRLDQTISRAEMAKVLGAALKLQKAADEAKQASPFPDTTGHWAAGWIAAARDRGIFQGRDDGLFHPQDQVTYAEVLTVLLRLTGRGPQAAVSWPWGAIATAAEVGMVPADMELGGRMYEAATRGSVFRLTAIAVGRTTLAGSGDTLLQSLGDRTPPTLDLVRVPAVTSDWRPILAARAEDAVTVRVGGADVDLQADGSFSVEVQLQKGENTVTFLAMDGAGNRSERTATVLFQPMAKLAFAPDVIETSVGQAFKPEIFRYDAQGKPTPAESVTWSYDSGALTR
ncbi:MAG TPA: S-layer homology domain-containing protein, partial [Symbiobacteriaceae bacterium]|nr:S-layer homology domain-containing protein [Symbiobacteriaceae bacterium]